MNIQEREVISDIFRRLEQVADQPRDPEAERFITEKIRQQPYAPYAMAQALFVQEQALTNLHQQIQQLEGEVERLQSRPQSGGLLGSLFGGSQEPERPPVGGPFGQPRSSMHPGGSGPGGQWGGGQPGPWGGGGPGTGQPGAFGAPQRGGSGFLGTAMSTAAGVAGGMLLGNVLASAFGGGGKEGGGKEGGGNSLFGGDQGPQANASGDHSDLSPFPNSGDGAGLHDAGYEPNDDFGADFGGDAGDGDWA